MGTSINNYQLVWLFIKKINRRCALLPLRDQDGETVELKSRGRIECVSACTFACVWVLFVPTFVFVCDLGSKLIMCNAPGKPMFPP